MDKRLKIILLWIIILVTGVYRHVDASTWSEINPTTSPPASSGHTLAYDNKNNVVVMFGGKNVSGRLNDTWIYDISTGKWSSPNPSNPPPHRSSHSMVYDSENEVIVLFGGIDANGELNDTWIYDIISNQWIKKLPSLSPPARSDAAIAYDPVNGIVILFGGQKAGISLADTWIYNASANTWTDMNPVNAPSARELLSMGYDLVNQRVVLFGGDGGCLAGGLCNDTWEYDFAQNQWTERIADGDLISPQARVSHSLSYIGGGKLLLFGGRPNGGLPLDNIWTYDYAANLWIQEIVAPSPSARIGHEIVYIGGNKVLLFGGNTGSIDLNDTWIYESQMSLSG
ncbi:MAG: Kelch repeat-containing protein, partial [Nitrospirota bacterium]